MMVLPEMLQAMLESEDPSWQYAFVDIHIQQHMVLARKRFCCGYGGPPYFEAENGLFVPHDHFLDTHVLPRIGCLPEYLVLFLQNGKDKGLAFVHYSKCSSTVLARQTDRQPHQSRTTVHELKRALHKHGCCDVLHVLLLNF